MGKLYKDVRNARGLTLSEASQDVGISSYSRFENGLSDINNSRLGWSQEALALYASDLRNHAVLAPVHLDTLAYSWGTDTTGLHQNLAAIAQLHVAPDNLFWHLVADALTELVQLQAEPQIKRRRLSSGVQARISHYLLHHVYGLNDYDFALTIMPALDPNLALLIGYHAYQDMRDSDDYGHTIYYYQTIAVVSEAAIVAVNGGLAPDQLSRVHAMLAACELEESFGVVRSFDCMYAKSLLAVNTAKTDAQLHAEHVALVQVAADVVIAPRYQYIRASELQSGRLVAAELVD